MKKLSVLYLTATVALILSFATNCKKDDPDKKDDPLIPARKINISGYVQKGPFFSGSSVFISELNTSLGQTGRTYTTQIFENSGLFEIEEIILESEFLEISANGYYYDEVNSEKTSFPLLLKALTDTSSLLEVNVNILTHLETLRVKYLMEKNYSFTEAKKKVQGEILGIFSFNIDEINNSEELDITKNAEEDAILLAISVILQGKTNVSDLPEKLSQILIDMKEDGILDDPEIKTKILSSAKELDLDLIRLNLESKYEMMEIDASIPDFEKYVKEFLLASAQRPVSIALPATNITNYTVTLNGEVDPGLISTTVVFEYDTNLTYSNHVDAIQSPVTGNFPVIVSADISQLLQGTTYHFRLKAENAKETVYSDGLTFNTTSDGKTGDLTDIDGNNYNTVVIGNQTWMAENLKTKRFNDGTEIEHIKDSIKWWLMESQGFTWSFFGLEDYDNFGGFYNGYAITTGKLCPADWHVPDSLEWIELQEFLGGELVAGGKLKSNVFWVQPNIGATNETGFSAEPYGMIRSDGFHEGFPYSGYWGSSTIWKETIIIGTGISWDSPRLNYTYYDIKSGYNIRCVKDD